jgi:hypothetical protein
VLFEIETPSGTTLLSGFTRQREAIQAAALISLAHPLEVILVTCLHYGVGSHQVCAICNGILRNREPVN